MTSTYMVLIKTRNKNVGMQGNYHSTTDNASCDAGRQTITLLKIMQVVMQGNYHSTADNASCDAGRQTITILKIMQVVMQGGRPSHY